MLIVKERIILPVSDDMVQKQNMLMLKCGFCALSEGCLTLSSLEVARVTPFPLVLVLVFYTSPIVQNIYTCFDMYGTGIAFKLAHGCLSRGL